MERRLHDCCITNLKKLWNLTNQYQILAFLWNKNCKRRDLLDCGVIIMAMPNARPDQSHRPVRLTKREVEVLSLIAQGYSSKEAADRLFVSKRTVDFHLGNIYEKLEVSNRVQAFRAATRLGLIPFEPTFGHHGGES